MVEPKIGASIVGRRIREIRVAEGEHALRFDFNIGEAVVWTTEGDCCSESWWSDGFSLNALRGGTVVSVRELDMPPNPVCDVRTRQESDQVYGFEIVTDYGKSQFVFRNSSNGFYGGWAAEERAEGDSLGWPLIAGNDWRA